jgi:MrcB-like, N-terminal domain
MLQRATGNDLAQRLANALEDIAARLGLTELDLQVKAGGSQADFSPVPWVRVYSTGHSPSAQQGIYLVFLFAADGSRVYLSLNQGTSVPRPGGGMRATTKRNDLLSRAAEARNLLRDVIDAGAPGAVTSIDLAWHGLESSASRIRARAYEAANILAREYLTGQIPPDEQLLRDLQGMLPMLARLYGVTPRPPVAVGAFDADSLKKLAVTNPQA